MVKLTQNPFSAPRWNKEETKRKKISQKAIVTARESRLVSQTKIAYSDFLKRPIIFSVYVSYNGFTTNCTFGSYLVINSFGLF